MKKLSQPGSVSGDIFSTESCLNAMRSWIKKYGVFCGVPVFGDLMGVCLKEIGDLVGH